MATLKQQYELIRQLQLPRKQKKYSYNDNLSGRVLFYMLLILEVIRQCDSLLKQIPEGEQELRTKELNAIKNKFINKMKDINYTLVVNHEKLQNLLRIIVKVREEEILQKIKAQEFLWQEKGTDLIKHFFVLKQFYMKIFRIRNFIRYNQRKILGVIAFHENLQTNCSVFLFSLQSIQQNQNDIIELESKLESIRRYLQSEWIRQKGRGNRESLQQLRRLAELVDRTQISNYTLLGLWSGVMLFMLTTIIFLFINYDINFKSEPQFQITFPIWRGMCYFLLLLWLFGIQSYIFETRGVSFRMLTILNNMYIPKYPQLFSCAAFFTTVHLFMFMLYMLALAEFGINFPDNFQLHYFPGVSWTIFILFFFVPLPCFHAKKRLYPLYMIFRSFLSPILGTEFKFHWWTQIWVSFRQPLRDVLFTITYYFVDSSIIYQNTIIYETLAGVFIYSMRIIQNIRQMKQNNLCGGMPFFGSIKCFLNIITITISYLFRVESSQLSNSWLILWIISAIISTSYAYNFDIKYDWGLIQKSKDGKRMIRTKTVFGTTKLYYSMIIINLIFRFIWVLNISPDILRQIPLERYILILVVSSLQILRRNIWSILRIQNEHLIAQRYYESIGVYKEEVEEQTEKGKHMLVQMGDLNKTFCIANQKAMNQIYEQCQQQIVGSPLKKSKSNTEKSFEELQDMIQNKTANKENLMEMLILQIEQAHNNLHFLAEEANSFLNEYNYQDYINTSTQLFSERDNFY